jgi:hypothetical protein
MVLVSPTTLSNNSFKDSKQLIVVFESNDSLRIEHPALGWWGLDEI